MLGRKCQCEKLFSDFNPLQFARGIEMVLFGILLVFMTIPTHGYGHVSADIPKVLHPVSLPGTGREDGMRVTVTRDGKLFFGIDQVIPGKLSAKIVERLKDRSVERKVYIAAPAGARRGISETGSRGSWFGGHHARCVSCLSAVGNPVSTCGPGFVSLARDS